MISSDTQPKHITIAHLTTDSQMGGTEHMILSVANGLNAQVFRSIVITLVDGGELRERCNKANIPYYSVQMKSKCDVSAYYRLKALLRSLKIDILHTYLFHANALGRVAGKHASIPVIISGQRNVDPWRKWYHTVIDRITARYANLIISNSRAGKQMLVDSAVAASEKIAVVHNGIDIDYYPDCSIKKQVAYPVKLLTIGSLTHKKGHKYLIDALSELHSIGVDCTLTILGEGQLEQELILYARDKSLENAVRFEGFKPNVTDYLSQTDIFVLPSLWEGLPVALMQAMACGIPCVATNVGGIKELIENDMNGILVEPHNSHRLCNAILRLVKNDELRYTFGSKARTTIAQEYSKRHMISTLENTYKTFFKESSL